MGSVLVEWKRQNKQQKMWQYIIKIKYRNSLTFIIHDKEWNGSLSNLHDL